MKTILNFLSNPGRRDVFPHLFRAEIVFVLAGIYLVFILPVFIDKNAGSGLSMSQNSLAWLVIALCILFEARFPQAAAGDDLYPASDTITHPHNQLKYVWAGGGNASLSGLLIPGGIRHSPLSRLAIPGARFATQPELTRAEVDINFVEDPEFNEGDK